MQEHLAASSVKARLVTLCDPQHNSTNTNTWIRLEPFDSLRVDQVDPSFIPRPPRP